MPIPRMPAARSTGNLLRIHAFRSRGSIRSPEHQVFHEIPHGAWGERLAGDVPVGCVPREHRPENSRLDPLAPRFVPFHPLEIGLREAPFFQYALVDSEERLPPQV